MADLAMDKTHLILVNAVVRKNDKVLISQRSWEETHEPGKWTIPGGKVERSPEVVWNILEKTVAQEVMQETGIKIKDQVQLIMNNSFIRSTGQHVVALIFLCDWLFGSPQPLEDTIDVKWISESELDDYNFAPNVKTYIEAGFKTSISS